MSESESLRESVVGGFWIFMGNISISILGFVFWLAMARIVGLDPLGRVSTIISAASIATTLVGAGLNLAVLRVVSVHRREAVLGSLLAGIAIGSAASMLVAPLVLGVGLQNLLHIAVAFTFLSTLSVVYLSILVGLEMFRKYFTTALLASLAKLCIGVSLGVLGLSVLSVAIGYLAYPITVVVVGTALLLQVARKSSRRCFKEVLMYTYANYPYAISTQLMIMLNIFVFAYLSRAFKATGALYIAFMIMATLCIVPNALLTASLPITTRIGGDVYSDALRLGLGVTTPLIALLLLAPQPLLHAISRELVEYTDVLRVLLLAVVPTTYIAASIIKLNRYGEPLKIAIVGVVRLASLLILLPPLIQCYGSLGAALAYLTASIIAIPLAYTYTHIDIARPGIVAALCTTFYLATPYLDNLWIDIALAISTLPVLHITNTLKLSELIALAKLLYTEITRR